jgi:UDP-N-acetylglucosamine 2-epimerase
MAEAVKVLASELKMKEEKIIIMGGHREGILAFGKNLEEATTKVIEIYNRYQND